MCLLTCGIYGLPIGHPDGPLASQPTRVPLDSPCPSSHRRAWAGQPNQKFLPGPTCPLMQRVLTVKPAGSLNPPVYKTSRSFQRHGRCGEEGLRDHAVPAAAGFDPASPARPETPVLFLSPLKAAKRKKENTARPVTKIDLISPLD